MSSQTDSDEQQQADTELHFANHGDTRISKLEPHRIAITKMRESNWPYRKIAEWLRNERALTAGTETIRNFCRVRGIEKGRSEAPRSRRRSVSRNRPPSKARTTEKAKEIFIFDDTKPLQTRRNRLGGED